MFYSKFFTECLFRLVVLPFTHFCCQYFFPNCQLHLLTTLSGFRLSLISGPFFFFLIRQKLPCTSISLILESSLKVSSLFFIESHDVLGLLVSHDADTF